MTPHLRASVVLRASAVVALAVASGTLVGCENRPGLAAEDGTTTSVSASADRSTEGSTGDAFTSLTSLQDRTGQDGSTEELGQEISRSRETAIVLASERVAPGVVAVNVLRTQQVRTQDPFWDDFFFPFGGLGRTTARLVPSLGSGFVVDSDGLVLTNDHVVRGAERILVAFPDGSDAEAVLVGTDEATDVAVLRVEGQDLPTVPIGRTDDLRIGEWVLALGNPFGNMLSNPEPTVTVGVVSAVERHIVPSQEDRGFYLGMIQTDAAINPGNSGGPLVNAVGEVVGMNASIFSRSGGSEGLGFAIPIERVLRIADDLIEYGEVRRAWLGIEVEPEEADEFGRTRGVRVARSAEGSPAARAGVEPGDHLLSVGGQRLATPLDFEAALLDLRAGEEVRLVIEGTSGEVRLTAEELPSLRAERVRVFQDLELVTLTDAIRSERGVQSPQGALVTGISPYLQSAMGLRAGDVIVGLYNRRIEGVEDLTESLGQIPPGSRVRLFVERNRNLLARDFRLGQ